MSKTSTSVIESFAKCGPGVLDAFPALVLYARDPRPVREAISRVAPGLVGVLGDEMSERVEVTVKEPVLRRVLVARAFGSQGELFIRVPVDNSELKQSGAIELARTVSAQRMVVPGRRVIVLEGANYLVRHLQHALRKVMEKNVTSVIFILTARSPTDLDPPLLSRSVVLNCSLYGSRAAVASSGGPSRRLLDRLFQIACGNVRVKRDCELKADECSELEAPGALAVAAEFVASKMSESHDSTYVSRIVRVAAEADHMRALGCRAGARDCARIASRYFSSSLAELGAELRLRLKHEKERKARTTHDGAETVLPVSR
jgi:hypothetical protein